MIVCVLIAIWGYRRYAVQKRMVEMDKILRQLDVALRKKDYDTARQFCAVDFDWNPVGKKTGRGATDDNLKIIASHVHDIPIASRPRTGHYNCKDHYYIPQAIGRWPYLGKFYVFRKENGYWKFTGYASSFHP
jgi:hypothetical protein